MQWVSNCHLWWKRNNHRFVLCKSGAFFIPPIRSLGISLICGRFLWIHSWHTPGCGLSNQGSQGSGQDPPAQQPNGCHFHISFCGWELNYAQLPIKIESIVLFCCCNHIPSKEPSGLQPTFWPNKTKPETSFYMFLYVSIMFHLFQFCFQLQEPAQHLHPAWW